MTHSPSDVGRTRLQIEAAMKRAIFLTVLFSCGSLLADDSVPAPPQKPTVLDEIVHMSQAGAPEDTVLAYAQAHRAELPSRLSDADLQWLRQAGVGERTVRYLRAVDVRVPAGAGQQGYTYGPSGEMPPRYVGQQYPAPPPSEAYDPAYPNQPYPNQAYPDNGYVGYDSAPGPYDDNGFYNYWYTPYFNAYPYYAYPYYYPYYPYYYPYYAFHGHGHGHGHDGHVDHHGGHGNWGNGNTHNNTADSWRSRGSVAQRNSPMTMGPRSQGSQAYARGNVATAPRGYRGNVVARGNMAGRGAPSMARGGMSRGAAPAGPRGGGFTGGSRGGGHASGGSGGHGRH
jgi:hypothetical protein